MKKKVTKKSVIKKKSAHKGNKILKLLKKKLFFIKQKGFTLVELLAVIAILAILVVFAVPNVVKMFEKSKKETFMNEVRSMYKDAKSKYMAAQMNGEDIDFVTINENDTKYCIILDNKGNPNKLAMSKNGYFIIKDSLSDINSIEEGDVHTGTMTMDDSCSPANFSKIYGTTSDGQTIQIIPLAEKYEARINIYGFSVRGLSIKLETYKKGTTSGAIENPEFSNIRYVVNRDDNDGSGYKVVDTFNVQVGSGNFTYSYNDTTAPYGPNLKYKVEAFMGDESIGIATGTFTYCFVAGTKVKTENGFVNIEDIKVGDKVYSYNLDNNNLELKEVTDTIKSNTIDTYKVTIGGKIVEMSPRHQVYIIDKGWVRAFDLEVGDKMLDINGNEIEISNIDYVRHNEPIDTYNLTVDGSSNYFVTDIQVLVHNLPS